MNRKPVLIVVWSAHRFLLISLGSLLAMNILLLSLLHFGVSPNLSQKDREINQLQQQLRRNEAITPQQAYEQGVADYARFRAILPSLRNFSGLIGDLYTLADKCNLEISRIAYAQKALPESDILSYDLKFSLSGSYDELKRFIYGLEESNRLIVMEQISLNSAKGEEGGASVTLTLSLTTYFGTGGQE